MPCTVLSGRRGQREGAHDHAEGPAYHGGHNTHHQSASRPDDFAPTRGPHMRVPKCRSHMLRTVWLLQLLLWPPNGISNFKSIPHRFTRSLPVRDVMPGCFFVTSHYAASKSKASMQLRTQTKPQG